MSWMSFLSPNHRCQNTEGNTKHWCERVAWPHPFFIHHQLMLEEELLPLRWISDASICDNYEVINGKCIVPHEAWYYSENEYLITTWCQLCFRVYNTSDKWSIANSLESSNQFTAFKHWGPSVDEPDGIHPEFSSITMNKQTLKLNENLTAFISNLYTDTCTPCAVSSFILFIFFWRRCSFVNFRFALASSWALL